MTRISPLSAALDGASVGRSKETQRARRPGAIGGGRPKIFYGPATPRRNRQVPQGATEYWRTVVGQYNEAPSFFPI